MDKSRSLQVATWLLALVLGAGCGSSSSNDGGMTDGGLSDGGAGGDAGSLPLYDKYGGASMVSRIVDDSVNAVLADCATAPYFTTTIGMPGHDSLARLKSCLRLQFTAALGGPATYPGTDDMGDMCESMQTIHAGLGISDAAFNAFVTDVGVVLATDGFSAADTNTVATQLIGLKPDIVSNMPVNYTACDGGMDGGTSTDGGTAADAGAPTDGGTADGGTDGGTP